MPLNKKGKKIKRAMQKQYGKKKGEKVFYAMESSGKLKKVIKARGGDAARSDAASGRSAGRADPSGGVDRSAVGEGSQYSRNKAKASLEAQRKQTIKQLTPPSQRLSGRALQLGLTLAGVPFAGTITKKMIDKPYWSQGKKTKPTKDITPTDRDGPQIMMAQQPVAPVPVTPIEQIRGAYKKPTVSSTGKFGYSVGFKKGGMLRQGKPKLAKKGWK